MHGRHSSPAKNIFLFVVLSLLNGTEKSYDVEIKESVLLVDHVPGIGTNLAILTVRSSLIS